MKRLFTLAFLSLTSIAANAQQQNAGFETWVTYTSESETLDKPEHWTGSDSLTYGLEATLGLSPAHQIFKETTNVHGGSSAAKLVSHDVGSLVGVAPAILANGTISVDIVNGDFSFTGGAPVTERIYFVNAWMDYQPEVDDVGMMVVQAVLAGQGLNGEDSVVGVGQFITDGTNGYEHVSVALAYVDETVVPDHLQIAFFSSQELSTGYEGSTMYVDDVSFSPVSVKNVASNNNAVIAFPNPTTGMLNVQSMVKGTMSLEVFSLTGQLLHTQSFNGQTKADLSALSNGMYFYKVSNAAGQVVKQDKLILNK